MSKNVIGGLKNTGVLMPLAFAAMTLSLASCIKDEAPNAECDITFARANMEDAEDVFYNLSDTIAPINADLSASMIQFQRVTPWADLTEAAPVFTISEGATLVPASGTARDFSDDSTQVYFCIAEDEKSLLAQAQSSQSPADILASAAKSGHHVRQYSVQFKLSQTDASDIVKYDFSKYFLDSSNSYYIWSDPNPDGTARAIPNWASGNPGFQLAYSSAGPMEYPTTPLAGQGPEGCDAVKLVTCSSGSFGEMARKPIAAGSIYLGTFDISQAMTNTLHSTRFGENSTLDLKPVRLTGYYKYNPGKQMTNADMEKISGSDTPDIYCVVYRNHDSAGNPVVLYGDDIKSSPQIASMAEVTEWKANTTDWVKFSLGFTWKEALDPQLLENKGYNFTIVCTSSKGGATYTGAVGSELQISKFRMYYETEGGK